MTKAEYETQKGALLDKIERAFGCVVRDEKVIESIDNLSPYSFA